MSAVEIFVSVLGLLAGYLIVEHFLGDKGEPPRRAEPIHDRPEPAESDEQRPT